MIDIRVLENSYSEEWVDLLVNSNQYVGGADYTDFHPWILGAFKDGKLIGAVQICQGKPVGRVEMLAVDPLLEQREKARVVRALAYQAAASLKALGSTIMMGFIPFKLKAYKRALIKRGGQAMENGTMLAWRL